MYYSYGFYRLYNPTLVLILDLAFLLFCLITMWRIFTKAGEKGWKCLIPIYNVYKYFDIGWEGSKFWVIFLGSLALNLLSSLFAGIGRGGAIILLIISLAWLVYSLYISIKLAITMAHRFGKSTAFGVVGLWLFFIIGCAIIAFGSADYDISRDRG